MHGCFEDNVSRVKTNDIKLLKEEEGIVGEA